MNKLCGAKLLVEVAISPDSASSADNQLSEQASFVPAELTRCPTCHGPVRVREHLWQKATCVNGKCRTKFLVQADDHEGPATPIPVEIIMPPVQAVEPMVFEETQTPPVTPRVVSPVIIDPTYEVRKRPKRRFNRRQLFVCVLAFIPCLVLLTVISVTDNDISRWMSSVIQECTESLWKPVNAPERRKLIIPAPSTTELQQKCLPGTSMP